MTKNQTLEAMIQAQEKVLSLKGNKVLSVIGSCYTNSQLESCKNWVHRIAESEDEFTIFQFVIAMQFGRINGNEFDV